MRQALRPRPPIRLAVLGALATVGALMLSACDQVEQAATDAAGRAGCAVAQETLDQVTQEARQVVDDLRTDPQGAQSELQGISTLLDGLEQTLGQEISGPLAEAREAVDTLADQAQRAADGTAVDDVVIQSSQAELDRAIDQVTQIC